MGRCKLGTLLSDSFGRETMIWANLVGKGTLEVVKNAIIDDMGSNYM